MTLKWKPTVDVAPDIPLGDEQAFLTAMEAAGFRLPCHLMDEDLPILRGMAATAPSPGIYQTLINYIITHDSIDIWID